MPEFIPTSTEAEWLEARRKGITASEIAVVMGLSPYSSPYALYHQKLGILPGRPDSAVMERGRVLEPYIAEKFAAAHPEFAMLGSGRELFAHAERPWQMATPDRQVCECLGRDFEDPPVTVYGRVLAVAEFKTASDMSEWGEPGTGEIPVSYRAQVLWQMDVMGAARAYVAVLDVPRWEVREYVVEHDDSPVIEYPHDIPGPLAPGICRACGDLELMHEAARDFLGRIERQDPPDVDWRPATASALRALYQGEDGGDIRVRASLAISYQAAVKRYKAAGQRMDEMSAAVLEVIGNRRRAIDPRTGDPIATRSVSHPKRVSATLVRERYPAIAAECTPEPAPVIKLLPAKTKKAS